MSAETPGPKASSYLSNSPAPPCIPHPGLDQLGPPEHTVLPAPCLLAAERNLAASCLCPAYGSGVGQRGGARSPRLQGCQGDGCVRRAGQKGCPQLLPSICPPGALPSILRDVPLPWPTHAAGSVTPSPLAEEWGYLSLGWKILILPC